MKDTDSPLAPRYDVFREAIAAHMILQAAGVSADDLWVDPACVSPTGEPGQLGVIVRQGELQFAVTVGPTGMSRDEFVGRWPVFVRYVKTLSNAEAAELRDGTKIREAAVEIMAALRAKQMSSPCKE